MRYCSKCNLETSDRNGECPTCGSKTEKVSY